MATDHEEPQPQSDIPVSQGHEVIQAYLKTIDGSPGVYRLSLIHILTLPTIYSV